MDADRFDGLAKSLASGTSRRRVLKGLGGAVGAAALAVVGRGGEVRAGGGNSACAQWCHANFSGSAAGQCTSEAARGTGLCSSACGPGGAGGTLCGPTRGGHYTSYAGTTCCESGQRCDTGTSTCTSCPPDQVPCKYAPCDSDGFPGGTLCCGPGETCTADYGYPGHGLCTGTCSSSSYSAFCPDSDCPPDTIYYYDLCIFRACRG